MIKTKKSFTLIEMMISITLFSIIIIFLYQALNVTQVSNKFYSTKLEELENKSDIKKLMFLDIINATSKPVIKEDKNNNTRLSFTTSNLYHNDFFIHVTYLLSRNNKLIRIESKEKFKKEKTYELDGNSYIDILENNVTKFRVSTNKKHKKNYAIYLGYEDEKSVVFTLKSIKH